MKTRKSNLSLSLLYIAVFGLLVFTAAAAANNDKDPTNELQTLSRAGSDVTLSDGGGTVSVDDAGCGCGQ